LSHPEGHRVTQRRDIWAVVPIKGFTGAKQRLGTVFPPEFRRELAAIMVEDVLDALARSHLLGGIVAVTQDADAVALARRYGAEICSTGADAGHTAAVMSGAAFLGSQGRGMLSLPGDIPGVTDQEIDMLLGCHRGSSAFTIPAFTIVPSHDRRGSNAVIATPPDAVPLAYGDDSFLPHLDAARRMGIEPQVITLPGIGLDVDTPADLFAVAAQGWPTRTDRFLRGSAVFADALRAERSHADD